MRWLVSLWLDLWRGPFTANPADARPLFEIIGLTSATAGSSRGPREFTFQRRQ